MKLFLFLVAFTFLLVACCPKQEPCPDLVLTDEKWDMLGFDSINISASLEDRDSVLVHLCIFQDEMGKKDSLTQILFGEGLTGGHPHFCNRICPFLAIDNTITDTLADHLFFFDKLWSEIRITFDSLSYGNRNMEIDTIANMTIKNVVYPQVIVYQTDTKLFSPDTSYLKNLYFAPRKGIVKIELTPNHTWERIN